MRAIPAGPARTQSDTMNQSSSDEKGQKKDTESKPEKFLSAFIKAKNDLRIYPPTNPVVSESLEDVLLKLKESFGSEVVEILIEKERLLINGEKVGANDPRVAKLTLGLYMREIRKIALDPEITSDEMRLLLDALSMKTEDIVEAGGIVAIMQKRGIAHAAVENTAELTIVDGANLPVSDDLLPDLSDIDDLDADLDADFEGMDTPEGFSRMFVRVGDGDVSGIKRLRKLLGNPEAFTGMLEKCAIQLEKVEGDIAPASRVQRMLEMLQTLGAAISAMPSQDERSDMLKNMAVSVLGLSAGLRSELVNKGMMPKLALKGVESEILSRFPMTELADVLLENFQISGGAATVMEGYLGGLNLDRSNKEELTETLHYSLRQSGAMTPEVEALLKEEAEKVNAEGGEHEPYVAPDPNKARTDFDLPHVDGYPPETILFKGKEKAEMISSMKEELESPVANVMATTVLDLLCYEKAPVNHTELLERVASYIETLLSNRDYEKASELIHGLKAEREDKKTIFSATQLKPLDGTIEKYAGDQAIRRLLVTFKNLKKESSEFRQVTEYISSLGLPAIRSLLGSLEDENSRHVRLLTCQALAQMGELAVGVVAERLDHEQWYVVRNAASILGQIGVAECVPHLEKALLHPEPRVKREALKGLASIRTEEATELVCGCVQESDIEICEIALGWIAIMRAPQAMPALDRLLGNGFMWKADDKIVRLAIQALGAIDKEESLELLEKLTETRRLVFRRKKAAFIRDVATAALSKRKKGR